MNFTAHEFNNKTFTIAELKNLVATARIIDESKITTDEVQLLNRVTIKNVKNGILDNKISPMRIAIV